jgi:hypothetical protein
MATTAAEQVKARRVLVWVAAIAAGLFGEFLILRSGTMLGYQAVMTVIAAVVLVTIFVQRRHVP